MFILPLGAPGADYFPASVAIVELPQFDGGGGYHVTDHDTGGGTLYGVTEATWAEAARRGIVSGDLKDATRADTDRVLRVLFWHACRCDDLGAGLGLVVFGIAMASGESVAAKVLQRAVGALVDPGFGIIGPVTLAATQRFLNPRNPADLVNLLTDRDEQFFDGLACAQWFAHGWTNRAEAIRDAALTQLAAPGVLGTPAPT